MKRKTQRLFDSLFGSFEWGNIVNCTPHPCVVFAQLDEGSAPTEIFTIKTSGILPRVSVIETEHPRGHLFPFPLVQNELGKIEGLPENDTGDRVFIVSRMVFDATDRQDIICPDTGKSAIRDDDGRILGVTQFVAK